MPPVLNPRRVRLAARLREVRASAFRSGNAFARQLGWVQSRVSKLETGTQLPNEDDIREWVIGSDAGHGVEAELLELLAAARVEYVKARDVQRAGGLAARQASLSRLELQARHLREYQPAIIPGLVQTASYARELLSLPGGPRWHGATDADVEAMVSERIRRQAILYEPQRRIELVIGEAALYSPPGSPATLHGQLDRLLAVAGLDGLQLGVLRFRGPMAALLVGGFALHDEDFVLLETLTAEQRLDEPGEVNVYREAFEHLMAAAATGDEAVGLIRAAITPTAPPP
jgi:Domain of unknown function (DUF5753)